MASSLGVKFQGFLLSEILPKIARAIKEQVSVKIWNEEEARASSFFTFVHGNQINLEKIPSSFKNEDTLLMSFSLDEVHYFSRIRILDREKGLIESTGKFYRTEKRENERLLTFPGHTLFLEIENEQEVGSNVISFQAHKNDDLKFLKDFHRESELVLKYRVTDFSKNGLSFFINANEEEVFANFINQKFPKECYLRVEDNESFLLDDLEIVYIVTYVNPRASQAPMKKVGVHFSSNSQSNEYLEQFLNDSDYILEVEEQFEMFLKNEGQ